LRGWINSKRIRESDEGILLLLETTPDFENIRGKALKSKTGFSFLIPYFKIYRRYIIQLFIGLFLASLIQYFNLC